jgi:2-polyprenyl-6-methoxyphenol hydroxylase-like FAD-dependent oxidoreductase
VIAMSNCVGDRAVVLGAGMAGLLAARVLSEAYGEVIIVDRDELTEVGTTRRGVPQGFHAHALLARGQQVLDELFPGMTGEFAASGMPMFDMGEMRWSVGGVPFAPAKTGMIAVSVTRPALERLVRRRVAALPNVTFYERTVITGLEADPGHRRVTGARVGRLPRGADTNLTQVPDGSQPQPVLPDGAQLDELLVADLVVDATGRGSRAPVWLEEFGYQRPAEERVKIGLAYTTCEFLLPARPLGVNDWSIVPLATPFSPHGAFFGRVNGDRHMLSLTSMVGDPPPATFEDVLATAKSLPIPDIYEAIRDSVAVAGPEVIKFPASVRRHYERLTRFPAGFLVMGDGVCSFNPVYGQGMTVASLEAMVLRQQLRAGAPPDAVRFFGDISKVIDAPWGIAVGGDLAWPGVEGERTRAIKRSNAYMGKLMFAMTRDSAVTNAFMRVAGLIDPPQALMKPRIFIRVMRQSRHRPRVMPAPQQDLAAGPAAR